jgi:hypothetical protein
MTCSTCYHIQWKFLLLSPISDQVCMVLECENSVSRMSLKSLDNCTHENECINSKPTCKSVFGNHIIYLWHRKYTWICEAHKTYCIPHGIIKVRKNFVIWLRHSPYKEVSAYLLNAKGFVKDLWAPQKGSCLRCGRPQKMHTYLTAIL